jgi:pectate lyase
MKLLITVIYLAVVLTGCGTSASNTAANTANSKNANLAGASNTSSESNTDTAALKDTTPLNMNVSDMIVTVDSEKVGRMVTVTGGQLDKISYNSLLIREPGGRAFYCYGDFGDYTKMSAKIDSLSSQGRAPGATVKGIYKVASIGTGGELSPCVLTDLKN